jgi:FemAB-related protein (PEP-CTERM system-associated)
MERDLFAIPKEAKPMGKTGIGLRTVFEREAGLGPHNPTHRTLSDVLLRRRPFSGRYRDNSLCELSLDLWSETPDATRLESWRTLCSRCGAAAARECLSWLDAVCAGLRHRRYVIEARRSDRVVGLLPLAYVKSLLFGRFLVSLPYTSSAGVIAEDEEAAGALVDRAVQLADALHVRHLELRHEAEFPHPALQGKLTTKVHMRLALPSSAEELWKGFDPKVRNQVRKGEKSELSVHWDGPQLLGEFCAVFSRNMRDLGTPVFGRKLFSSILGQFGRQAELCVVRRQGQPIAAALLVHGNGMTEVPSASSLREYNGTNANMLMYWRLLQRAVERGQKVFDFGRSSRDGSTFRFKKQWGAEPEPAVWQYYVPNGTVSEARIESGKYERLIAMWRRLPLWMTRLIGPSIVRGIPNT